MRKRHLFTVLGLGAALLAGCESGSNPSGTEAGKTRAGLGKTGQQKIPVDATIPGCGEETIALSGGIHLATRAKQDGQDRWHIMLHANFQDLTGITSGGDTLAGGGASTITETLDALPASLSDTVVATLISADATDTVQVSVEVVYTFGPDGEITTSVSTPMVVCPVPPVAAAVHPLAFRLWRES